MLDFISQEILLILNQKIALSFFERLKLGIVNKKNGENTILTPF
jgi:hypothetical protein